MEKSCFCRSALRLSTVSGSLFSIAKHSMSMRMACAGEREGSAASGSPRIFCHSSSSAGESKAVTPPIPGSKSKRRAFSCSPIFLPLPVLPEPEFLPEPSFRLLEALPPLAAGLEKGFFLSDDVRPLPARWNGFSLVLPALCSCRTSQVASCNMCVIVSVNIPEKCVKN